MKDFISLKQRQRDCKQQISDRIKKISEEPVSCTSLGFYLFVFLPCTAKKGHFKFLHLKAPDSPNCT